MTSHEQSIHLTRALARRERHRQRPLSLRALTLAAVLALVTAGVLIVIDFDFWPPFVLPAVVAILALEFRWAARLVAWAVGRWVRLGRALRRAV
jgi:hypothetical protein